MHNINISVKCMFLIGMIINGTEIVTVATVSDMVGLCIVSF